MLESKLWLKTEKETKKKLKGAKMVGFIKTCEQYSHKFNFGHFFSSIVSSTPPPPALSSRGDKFFKNAAWRKLVISFSLWANDKNLGESFACEHE